MRATIAIVVALLLLVACIGTVWWAVARGRSATDPAVTAQQAATRAQRDKVASEEADQAHRNALAFYDLLMSGQTTDLRNATTGQARRVFDSYARRTKTDKVTGYTITRIRRTADTFVVSGYETLANDRFRAVVLTMHIKRIERTPRGLIATFTATNLKRAAKTVSVPPL